MNHASNLAAVLLAGAILLTTLIGAWVFRQETLEDNLPLSHPATYWRNFPHL